MDFQEVFYLISKLSLYQDKMNRGLLSLEDKGDILKIVSRLERLTNDLNKLTCSFGSLLDYDSLLNKGFNLDEVKKFMKEDKHYIESCENKLKDNLEKREHMFGYPANMQKDSYVTKYLRTLESKTYLMNGCGDPEEQGNYQMDNKENEKEIVNLIMQNINLNNHDYWGYITTGGTEGNIWGINYGLNKYKDANLYYSNSTHYSITKANLNGHNLYPIATDNDKVNLDFLLMQITTNYHMDHKPVVLILNFGTTKMGAVDDIKVIKEYLVKQNIPHYIHVDAALYGGIGANQVNSPYIDFHDLNIDSISISLHKYLGLHECKGVVLAKREHIDKYIDYIGQNDTTLCGSRDFPPFSTLQKVRQSLERQDKMAYIENINFFVNCMEEYDVPYWRGNEYGNTFIIEKPSDLICEKYQLATFSNDNLEYAHVIIFAYHDQKVIEELVKELSYDKRKGKRYEKL